MSKYYAGIGGRNTPQDVCNTFSLIGLKLEPHYILRSGGADGADIAFEKHVGINKEIWLPWLKFNNNLSPFILETIIPKEVVQIAKKYYTRWDFVEESIRRLHARNVYQILGRNLVTPVEFVVCWTDRPDTDTGGTQFGMHLAKDYGIPVYNFYTLTGAILFEQEVLSKL